MVSVSSTSQTCTTSSSAPIMYYPPITQYNSNNINANSQVILKNDRLQDSTTNKTYKRGQLLFIEWCLKNNLSPDDFCMKQQFNLTPSTLQLYQFGITRFHADPDSIRKGNSLNKFISILLDQALPVRTHCPNIDLSPTFQHLADLSN
ncbi:uncharacterized protein B0P05DRAFT_584114 [Gilbertella persicaria]|uniref:uncharacterized protein n=1 Tax=Gilbertella persicaria TaxID=101096 RepID=UPI00221F01AD|nr:uncharacterized protein B0P05DRAFT_584114 [Gilbertella persicaria]KAI8090990.1 hypothetical protein B0P05DRAFT_584114 [Gilbertella persicaria]